jgi:molecular chaperone GrpE
MPEEPATADELDPPGATASAPPPVAPEDWEKRFTYLYADFENLRRRMGRDRDTARHRAQAELLTAILPIVEAAEKAVEAVRSRPAHDPVRKGVELLDRTIAALLADQGVRFLGQAGEPFRPEEMEAVGETAPSQAAQDGHVAEVVQLGFAFPGGLLRPAKVVVARRPAKAAATPPSEDKADHGSELAP